MRGSRRVNEAMDESRPVIVVGAGFAGLQAVRRLGRAGVRTVWVDARNYHCFLPLVYQVAIAGLEPQEIAYPARSILRRFPTVDFRLARVVAADPAARTVRTAVGVSRMTRDRITLLTDWPSAAISDSARMMGGRAMRQSTIRWLPVSVAPPT